MVVSPRLLSEIELLPREYEEEVLNFVSFLRSKIHIGANTFTKKNEVTIENAYGILKGMNINANIERDEEDRI